jgi:hypothetical protein
MELLIELSPSLKTAVQRWIRNFKNHEPDWADYPKIKRKILRTSALAFPFLLAYADPKDSNEFDLKRLKTLGIREIQHGMMKNPRHLRFYRHAMKNLGLIETGELLRAKHELQSQSAELGSRVDRNY